MQDRDDRVGPLRRCGLIDLLEEQHQKGPPHRVWSIETGEPAPFAIPELATGRHMIPLMDITEEFAVPPAGLSSTPWVCGFANAKVHGPLGTIRLDDVVVGDTMPDSQSAPRHYTQDAAGIHLNGFGRHRRLAGATLSLLTGGAENYYHWTLDGLGRLAAAGDDMLAACRYLLVPRLRHEFQSRSLAFAGLAGMEIVEVEIGDCITAERLLVPWRPMEDYRPHPSLPRFFRRLAADAPCGPGPWPARVYVDRSASPLRRLVNEAEVMETLAPLGFIPVRLQSCPLEDQIALFRHAECIVAPHGAGLTNLVYAAAGCRIVELQMNSYVHWCFRVLAAAGGLTYDCAIGRQYPSNPAALPSIHQQSWAISPMHVRAAVEHILIRA
jgi:capsular polysaccharide biosynthesis protein